MLLQVHRRLLQRQSLVSVRDNCWKVVDASNLDQAPQCLKFRRRCPAIKIGIPKVGHLHATTIDEPDYILCVSLEVAFLQMPRFRHLLKCFLRQLITAACIEEVSYHSTVPVDFLPHWPTTHLNLPVASDRLQWRHQVTIEYKRDLLGNARRHLDAHRTTHLRHVERNPMEKRDNA